MKEEKPALEILLAQEKASEIVWDIALNLQEPFSPLFIQMQQQVTEMVKQGRLDIIECYKIVSENMYKSYLHREYESVD